MGDYIPNITSHRELGELRVSIVMMPSLRDYELQVPTPVYRSITCRQSPRSGRRRLDGMRIVAS
jgi:hypothetical protein